MSKPDLLIDACCLINLAAVDTDLCSVIAPLPWALHIALSVQREELAIRPSCEAAKGERRRIDVTTCLKRKLLSQCATIGPREQSLYVRLAIGLGDGEAMSIAIAANRGWLFATDDVAAVQTACDLRVATVSTPMLVKAWCDAAGVTAHSAREALRRVEVLARYTPSKRTAGYSWWQEVIGRSSV